MKRPLFVMGMCFFLSTAAALLFGDNFAAAVGVFLLLCAAITPLLLRRHRAAVAAALICAAVALGNVLIQDLTFVRPLLSLADRTVLQRGRVVQIEHFGASTRYLLDASFPLRTGRTLRAKLSVSSAVPLSVEVNEEIEGYVRLYEPYLEGRARTLALSERLLLSGVFEQEPRTLPPEETARTAGWFVTELRERMIAQNRKLLPGKDAALLNAVLLGDKSRLEEETLLDFQRAGLLHLMAVSGFHLTLVTALFSGLLRAVGLPRRWAAAGTLPFLLLFMAVAGFTPSVLRAGWMAGLCLAGTILGEQYDALSGLGLALWGILTVNPYSALNVGFLLSFFATAGILLLAPRIRAALLGALPEALSGVKMISLAGSAFSVSLGAYLMTLPVMLYYFDTLSVLAPLASFLAMPVATLLLWCAVPALAMSFIPFFFPLARALSFITSALSRMLLSVAGAFSSFPFALVWVPYEFVKLLVVVFYVAALLLLALGAPARTKRLAALLGAMIFAAGWASASIAARDTVQIVTFEGIDAALMTDGKSAALIGFPRTAGDGGRIAAYLRMRNLSRLDLAMSLSGDNEDVLGALPVFRSAPPARLVMPQEGRYTPNILSLAAGARKAVPGAEQAVLHSMGAALTVYPCSCGRACKIEIDGASLLKTNENCVIMKTDAGTQAVLRGWKLVRVRESGKMTVSSDENGRTTYTFRKSREESA